MMIYRVFDDLTRRLAQVDQDFAVAQLPFIVCFYNDAMGTLLDHTRRFSTAGMAEAAADEWCSGG